MRLGKLLLYGLTTSLLLAQTEPPPFDVSTIDRSANPCVDFYQYACGTWMAQNPIPPDQARWSRFDALSERNQLVLKGILEKAAAGGAGRTPLEQKIGDYYATCLDEKAIDAQGLAPLQPELDRIAGIRDRNTFTEELARLHRLGGGGLFSFTSSADQKNSSQMIAAIYQGGLTLPDRDYYLKTDAKSVKLREHYQAHVEKVFGLLGYQPAEAAAKAKVVVDLETALARASLDRVSLRDPTKRYHKYTRHELESLAPELNWDKYFDAVGAPRFENLNVSVPPFLRELDTLLHFRPVEEWKAYLTWHLVHAQSDLLPAAFREAAFEFFDRELRGLREMRPRWKQCVAAVDGDLGEALGQKFVERTFGAEGKQRMLTMVAALRQALAKDIRQLPWMTPATKERALAKLSAMTEKIGYPDKWRDYGALPVVRGKALANSFAANEFQKARSLRKIGKDTDPAEWHMTPPTVNAYYSPLENNINFPAGILQPPFFDRNADDAVNFGGIGAVIGHEMTHGFDDQGRKYDARGNVQDWWTPDDTREFEKRAQCLVEEYSGFTAVGDVKLNGKLTLGENTADNGGVRVAYMALLAYLAGRAEDKIAGFTPEQRFFLGYAQIWCQNTAEAQARLRAVTDPHSPGRYRVNGVVSNMPEFRRAFGCGEGQPMVRPDACRVW
ncbi:MAG TPA: M13 family metallopeptidase [Bryobacteraceae bacterium]|nr:M13 family metallopeptidase [Bryobacteraceae bacterium]